VATFLVSTAFDDLGVPGAVVGGAEDATVKFLKDALPMTGALPCSDIWTNVGRSCPIQKMPPDATILIRITYRNARLLNIPIGMMPDRWGTPP
jgi:hypothetical protein